MQYRLSRVLSAAVILTMTAACDRDATSPAAAAPTEETTESAVGAAVTTSNSTSLVVGTTKRLYANRDIRRYKAVKWVSSDPSIVTVNSSGDITGVALGSASVTVSSVSDTQIFPITVVAAPTTSTPTPTPTPPPPTTTPTAPTLVKIDLTPKPVQVAPRGTKQFTPWATWSDGSKTTPAVVYSTNSGSITSGGMYTAPSSAGTSRVIARQSGGTKADTVFVTVANSVVSVTPTTPTLSSFVLSPATGPTLTVGTTRQFSSSATWSDGVARTYTVTYTAAGGTISTSGLFTAGSVGGSFLVIATCSCGALDTSVVSVATVVPTPVVTSIGISPKTVGLSTGGSQQFAASARWSDGASNVPTVLYSTTGGTVSSTGAYVAPSTAGTYRVILAQSGGTLRDTAVVTVTAPVPPAPVPTAPAPVPSDFTPNLPAGLSLVVDTKFGESNVKQNSAGADGLFYSNWGSAFQSGSNVTVAGAPYGTSAFQQLYPGNDYGNGTGGAGLFGANGQKWTKVYFSMAMYFSPSYSMHSNGEKWLYMYTTSATDQTLQPTLVEFVLNGSESPNGSSFGLEMNPNYNLGIMYPQETGSPWYWLYQNSGTPRLKKGVWQNVEIAMTMNTPGNADGTWKAWINGTLVASKTGLTFRGGTDQGYFQGIKFDGTRGGGASSTPTPAEGQSRLYNRLAWYAN